MPFPYRAVSWLALFVLLFAPSAGAYPDATASNEYETLRAGDLRLAEIGYRLSSANAPMCDRKEAGTGLLLHTLAQYTPAAGADVRAHFRFEGPVAVEAVVPGSPAAVAGIRADDTVVAINGVPVSDAVPDEPTTNVLIALHDRFAALPPAATINLALRRAGEPLNVQVTPRPICLTRYELRIADSFDARANGQLVQITSKYLDEIDPELLPAVVAHELAHNILRHRDRLESAGADFGLASGFGRNMGLFRQTEMEADILAVHLLAQAGYSPDIAARFWEQEGARLLRGMIRSRSHPPIADRVAIARAEAAKFATPGALPPPPAFFAARNAPLDGDWKKLLPGR